QRGKTRPFLLSLHYTAPHWPWETRADAAESKHLAATKEHIGHVSGGSVDTYLTMIRQMDEGIGRVLAQLKAIGADENTLVVFSSDNGGERFSDVWPLTGKKMDVLEGGIRVPYLVRWPARVRPGSVTRQAAITMDWVPTMLEAAGVRPHPDYPLDGLSLLDVLGRPEAAFERELFWRTNHRNQRALRAGRWKYVSTEDGEFLYDLERDARERANRAKREPERLAAMRARYAEWEKTMPGVPQGAKVSLITHKSNMATPTP
ncbi:MAG TPA: sulfatase-like hydrolase/transferase, partial [Burkholderiales bacterium]|nr:sulfatase-like hydrolase/transferase [Burkholderiales bacterium]